MDQVTFAGNPINMQYVKAYRENKKLAKRVFSLSVAVIILAHAFFLGIFAFVISGAVSLWTLIVA